MPKMEAFISGAWRAPARGEVLIGGAWRRIVRAEAYRGGGWVSIASFVPPLSLSVNPSNVTGIAYSSRPMRQPIASNQCTATPNGGTAPYSYSWTTTSGTAFPTTPSTASTAFRDTLGPEQESSGTGQVICTDANGNTAVGQCDYYLYNQSNQ